MRSCIISAASSGLPVAGKFDVPGPRPRPPQVASRRCAVPAGRAAAWGRRRDESSQPHRSLPLTAAMAALHPTEVPMRIGIPRETKTLEGRVALVPEACADLVRRGHEVWIESQAGVKSGFPDERYTAVGVKIAPDAAALYEKGELIVKVKEPIAGDLAHLRRDHLLFCYLHLAAEPELTRKLLDIGLTGVAFETVELDNGD